MTLNIVIIHILIVSCSTGKILLCARVVLYFIQFFFKVILIQVCVHNCILFANCHASVCSCEGANIEICTESIPLYVCCMRNTCLVFFHEHNQKLKIEIWKKKMLMKKKGKLYTAVVYGGTIFYVRLERLEQSKIIH